VLEFTADSDWSIRYSSDDDHQWALTRTT
jgi:hypothetical protein